MHEVDSVLQCYFTISASYDSCWPSLRFEGNLCCLLDDVMLKAGSHVLSGNDPCIMQFSLLQIRNFGYEFTEF